MLQHIVLHLSTLLVTQFLSADALAMPGWNNTVKPEPDLIVRDDFEKLAPSASRHVVSAMGALPAESSAFTVTLTTVETTIVGTVTAPDTMDISSSPNTIKIDTGNPPQVVTITLTVEAPAAAGTPGTGAVSTAMSVSTSFQHAGSTSPVSQGTNMNKTTETSATITPVASSSISTSTLDDIVCDDVFCNTDGNRVCIYWGGYTSWDVSLGPVPGERPTIIGTC
ncbi:hypothetical protein F4802DRAFT_360501 [Xylaria palmicola]|nr:hypothetical protein F4802DRAFT_360501 [Xylaria palmicola]